MKRYVTHLLLLPAVFFLTMSSCHKDEPKPDLVPITTKGANTMGFYVDGVPHNKKGQSTWSSVYGVRGGINKDYILHLFGGGGNPNITIVIDLKMDINFPLQEYDLNGSDYYDNRISIIDDTPLGGQQYICDSLHTGKLTLLKVETDMAAGTFYFDAVNPETGKVIHITDGRFDIQFF